MEQTTWNFIFIGITFAVYIGIAIWSRAGSTKEYYTAGGSVSPFANGMATAADWMSAATFISMAGGIAAAGYGASKVSDGMDRWVCVTYHLNGSLSTEIWKSNRA